MRNYIIITGASKGLGEGIALALLKPENHIVGVSRTKSEKLESIARKVGCKLDFVPFDLSCVGQIGELASILFSKERTIGANHVCLVNNAGVVEPVGTVGDIENNDMVRHVNINLISPMLLVSEFVKKTDTLRTKKRVLNISSGAATNPYEGWGLYCSGKAAIDMFTRCVAKEQATKSYPVHVMSIAPGVIDTQMQEVIRNSREEKFIHRQRFVELKTSGSLVPPDVAGGYIADLLLSDKFENGGVIDMRDKYLY